MSDGFDRLLIARGENDRLFDDAGRAYIDLFSAHGMVYPCSRTPHWIGSCATGW